MKIAGIIAEFNPFHNGHKYLTDYIRNELCADYIVVVMSGNFVQRGAPALLDKYLRAKMAAVEGADLVLELPVCYSTAAAGYFAEAGTALLDSLGCVDYLCFGSETGDLSALLYAAGQSLDENDVKKNEIKSAVRSGSSYAKALSTSGMYGSVDTSPNNILAVEYLKALMKRSSPMTPIAVKRTGSGYSDTTVSDNALPSALALRNLLWENESDISLIKKHLPPASYELLAEYLSVNRPVFADAVSHQLYYRLINEADEGFTKYLDISRSFSDRLVSILPEYHSFSELCSLMKTKELTHSRVSRCLMHIYLGITGDAMEQFKADGYAYYARPLAFRSSASPLLSAIKQNSRIPFVSKLSDYISEASPEALRLLGYDLRAGSLYDALSMRGSGRRIISECSKPLIIL